MNRHIVTSILEIILITVLILTLFPPNVKAVDVAITFFTPASHVGKVGDSVTILGTLNTTDGLYRIWFADQQVFETNAVGNNVNATFAVPSFPKGNHTITLQDVNAVANATTWFSINTAYYIKVNEEKIPTLPAQLQESDSVEIWVNVTGGEPNTIYKANITVKVPDPANETYWTLAPLTNTTTTGEGYNITTTYPNDFQGAPNTNYTGRYTIAFNATFATSTFSIGLTNSTEYHRRQLVDIKAAGYNSTESVTLKIDFKDETIHKQENVKADSAGLILANWTIPEDASIGTYTLNITSTSTPPTRKSPPDVQNFTVPGFVINMTTRNLAEEIVGNVTVQIFEKGKSVVNGTSDSDGLVKIDNESLKLEIGNYTCEAYFKNEKVGWRWLNITTAESFDFLCNLTNLKFIVLDEDGFGIPEAEIRLTPVNQTFATDVNGTAIAHSLLPNMTYVINASRYDALFNTTTIPKLLVSEKAVAWFNVTIVCPTLTLRLNVTDAEGQAINNAIVKIYELIGGPYYENTTTQGEAIFRRTFGKYNLLIYDPDEIKLNETVIELFQNLNVSMRCPLYGLVISVRIADYFGQPIANVNVTLQREGLNPRSSLTQSDGITTFDGVTGGSVWIAIYLDGEGQLFVAKRLFVDKSTSVEIKIEEYVMLAGFLVETSHLATVIIIVISVIAVLLIEIYRRRRAKTQKEETV